MVTVSFDSFSEVAFAWMIGILASELLCFIVKKTAKFAWKVR
jgi:hypothetical protein